MSELRKTEQIIPAVEVSDGAGVRLKRSLGLNMSNRLDPFLLLDAFASDNPDDYIAGFPPHPHRGFETLTYMLDGEMIHRDHMGNKGHLGAGGIQKMTAGRGVIHEERPQRVAGLMRGFQLWINLPAEEKMCVASYQNIPADSVPTVHLPAGGTLKVIAGELAWANQQISGPVSSSRTAPLYLDLILTAGEEVSLPVDVALNACIYLFEGDAWLAGDKVRRDSVVVLGKGNRVSLRSESGGRLLLLAGKPLKEPVVQYGPFVMNTQEQVEQAIIDYRDGNLTAA